MTTHVLHAHLTRPDALADEQWAAIHDAFVRLQNAVESDDRPLIVGSAKDLVEATARVILTVRGLPPAKNAKYLATLNAAHAEILYQPGPDIARDAAVRQAANAAKALACQLDQLRNTYGTGHGRATLEQVVDEVLETCIDGALLWTRWAVRRLHALIQGYLPGLLYLLRHDTFTRGKLAMKLHAANLPKLADEEQRQLGVAVGQRASSDTFNVWDDGVVPCVKSQDPATWPLAYREGLAVGLFLDSSGEIRIRHDASSIRAAVEALVPHPDRAKVLEDLNDKLQRAPWSRWNQATTKKALLEMQLADSLLAGDLDAERAWNDLTELVRRLDEAQEA